MKASTRRSSMINMDNSFATLSEGFYRLFPNLNEDTEESLVSLLEEKVIPKRHSSGDRMVDQEPFRRPKTLSVDKTSEHRRSFHRKRRDAVEENNQFLKTYEYYESLHSPAVARRRSSSIAVPQPTPDLQLQVERPYRAPSPKTLFGKKCTVGLTMNATPQRNRTCSMPVVTRQQKQPMLSQIKRPEDPDGYYRLRSFSITPNGVCKNLGDCLKTRRSRSSCSVDSSPANLSRQLSGTNSVESNNELPVFTVGMLGASNVGKTTLSYQFTTSEYICAYDTSLDDEFGQKTVCISLNGREAEFNIIDIPASEMSVETFCYTFNVDLFVVVYSITDSASFKVAHDILVYLWKNDYMTSKGVILVGNKADLERRREISADTGKALASTWHCKFVETSSGLDHHVDKLLVGIFKQVQLNPKRNRTQSSKGLLSSKKLFKSLLNFAGKRAKSCENLFDL